MSQDDEPVGEAESREIHFSPFLFFVEWATKNTLAAVTVLGLIAYGGLRLTFGLFYSRFGVTPEDVGYDYVTVLATTLPGVVAILSIVAFGFAIVFALTRRVLRWRQFRYGEPSFAYYGRFRASVDRFFGVYYQGGLLALRGVAVLLLYAVIILTLLIALQSTSAGNRARRGEPVRGMRIVSLPVLPWRVEKATLTPITKDAQTNLAPLGDTCLMYLGQSGMNYVLYDVQQQAAVRVPVTAVSIHVGQSAERCR